MLYSVRAKYIHGKLNELGEKLKEGSIKNQQPDGEEICASMVRARVTQPGVVQWTETCYCPTPLEHERETVFDHYFTQLVAVPIDQEVQFEGDSFIGLIESGK